MFKFAFMVNVNVENKFVQEDSDMPKTTMGFFRTKLAMFVLFDAAEIHKITFEYFFQLRKQIR